MAKSRKSDITNVSTVPAVELDIYEYTHLNAPGDIVVNNSAQTVIIGAEAKDKSGMSQRIDPGDRRRGPYFEKLTYKNVGLTRVKDLPEERLVELENIRQVRTGECAPKWVFEARERAAKGHNPGDVDNINRARSNLEIAIRS